MSVAGRKWPYMAFVIIQTIIFGSGNAITKIAYDSMTPLWLLAIRFGLALLIFAAFFGLRTIRQLKGVKLRVWLPAAGCMALAYLTANVALDMTSATNVGFLMALPVVFAPLLSSLINRRRYPLAFIPFQLIVVAGLYLLCNKGGALSFGPGELLALLSAAAMAGALVFGERGLAQLDAVAVAGTQIALSFVVSFACALVFEPMVNVAHVKPFAWATIAFLALLSTCLTFLLQNLSLKGLPSSQVSLLLTAEPVFTAAFSFILLGEVLSAVGMIGGLLIVGAVVAATYVEGRQNNVSQSGYLGRQEKVSQGASFAGTRSSLVTACAEAPFEQTTCSLKRQDLAPEAAA